MQVLEVSLSIDVGCGMRVRDASLDHERVFHIVLKSLKLRVYERYVGA